MTSDTSDDAHRLASVLLMTIVAIGAGLGVWLWASTAPELAIGEDIPAFAVLGGISVFLAALGTMGLIRFRWLMDTEPQGGSDPTPESTMAGDSDGDHSTIDNEASEEGVVSDDGGATTPEEETPDPVEAGGLDDSNEDLSTPDELLNGVNEAQLKSGISIEEPTSDDTAGGGSPNPNRPTGADQSVGRNQQAARDNSDSHGWTSESADIGDASTIEPEPRERRDDSTVERGDITPAPREQVQQWLRELVE